MGSCAGDKENEVKTTIVKHEKKEKRIAGIKFSILTIFAQESQLESLPPESEIERKLRRRREEELREKGQ